MVFWWQFGSRFDLTFKTWKLVNNQSKWLNSNNTLNMFKAYYTLRSQSKAGSSLILRLHVPYFAICQLWAVLQILNVVIPKCWPISISLVFNFMNLKFSGNKICCEIKWFYSIVLPFVVEMFQSVNFHKSNTCHDNVLQSSASLDP